MHVTQSHTCVGTHPRSHSLTTVRHPPTHPCFLYGNLQSSSFLGLCYGVTGAHAYAEVTMVRPVHWMRKRIAHPGGATKYDEAYLKQRLCYSSNIFGRRVFKAPVFGLLRGLEERVRV